MRKITQLRCLLLLVPALALAAPGLAASLFKGDLVMSDGGQEKVIRVVPAPVLGNGSAESFLTKPTGIPPEPPTACLLGPSDRIFQNPAGLTVDSSGVIYVVTRDVDLFVQLIRWDGTTCSVLSSGGNLWNSDDVEFDGNGQLLVTTRTCPTLPFPLPQCPSQAVPSLIRVDPTTGVQTVLSTFTDPGNLLAEPEAITVDPVSGVIYVADDGPIGASPLDPRIVAIDPVTGAQTLIHQGLPIQNPNGIVFEAAGTLVVVNKGTGFGEIPQLIRVDPAMAPAVNASVVANAPSPPMGTLAITQFDGLAIDGNGNIFVGAQIKKCNFDPLNPLLCLDPNDAAVYRFDAGGINLVYQGFEGDDSDGLSIMLTGSSEAELQAEFDGLGGFQGYLAAPTNADLLNPGGICDAASAFAHWRDFGRSEGRLFATGGLRSDLPGGAPDPEFNIDGGFAWKYLFKNTVVFITKDAVKPAGWAGRDPLIRRCEQFNLGLGYTALAYRTVNTDVAAAIDSGAVPEFLSVTDHYVKYGFKEGRLTASDWTQAQLDAWDDAAYMTANPDVATFFSGAQSEGWVAFGKVGFAHWINFGRIEGRSDGQP